MIETVMNMSNAHFVMVGILIFLCYAAVQLLAEPGPLASTTVLDRYGLLCAIPPLLVVMVVAALWYPVHLIAAAGIAAAVLLARPRQARNWIRRMYVRATWPSISRSCGLANTNDRRSASWPGGAVVNNLGSNRVEYLPMIGWGRRTGPDTVVWRIKPARGTTLADVGERAPALAAALQVAQVIVHQDHPYQGRLEVRWDR